MKNKQLGLTGYELEVYRSLLTKGLCSVRELSSVCSVPLTALYPNLHLLVKKGIVNKFEGDPIKYKAIKPKTAFDNLLKKNIDEMEQAKKNLIDELSSINEPQDQINPVDMSLGTSASISWWYEMAKETKKSIHIAGWRFGSKRSVFKLIHNIKELHKRGIKLKIIIIAKNERTLLITKECAKLNIPVRYLDMDNFSLIISDNKRCKITLKNRSLQERVNLKINDVDLVKGMNDYFSTLWSKAKSL